MLGSYPIDVMLLATDLEMARKFYGEVLGLEVLVADEQFLTFGCGGDSRLVITKTTTATTDQTTKASWRVADLAAEIAWLRARGVQIQDLPELSTTDGIADLGFALAAWFTDPNHNWIGLLQLKDPTACRPTRSGHSGSRVGGELEHGQGLSGPPASPERHRPGPRRFRRIRLVYLSSRPNKRRGNPQDPEELEEQP